MDSPDASRLEAEYDAEVARARRAAEKGEEVQAPAGGAGGAGKGKGKEEVKVEMMPTLDGRGRLYDVGLGGKEEAPVLPGNRRKVEKVSFDLISLVQRWRESEADSILGSSRSQFETRDPKTGDLLRLNADDDTTTLGDLVRQERFGAGAADTKNMDAEIAKAIAGDGAFRVSRTRFVLFPRLVSLPKLTSVCVRCVRLSCLVGRKRLPRRQR